MKVLWLTNVMPEVIAKSRDEDCSYAGGWINGLYNSLKESDLDFVFCFPSRGKEMLGKFMNHSYYGFSMKRKDYLQYSEVITKEFEKILTNEKPDIIQVFGTEYPYALSLVIACERLGYINKVIVNIQGLVSICKDHFFAEIPEKVRHGMTIKEFLRNNNLNSQYKDFCQRSLYEIAVIKKVKYIIGRTEWDKACVGQINSLIKYFHVNETMRESFYNKIWKYDECEVQTIFVSQGHYPLKGLHFMLEAFSLVTKEYPDARLKIAGDSIYTNLKKISKRTTYAKYIDMLIKKNHLENKIDFLGTLDEKKMCEAYLKANVFVSPSSIENSSNSISEGLLLGVPIIASNVGGNSSLIENKKDGILYPFSEPNMLAFYITQIFQKNIDVEILTKNAKEKGERMFDRENNAKRIKEVYNYIINES